MGLIKGRSVAIRCLLFVGLAVLGCCLSCRSRGDEVRMLGWVGYDEKDLLDLIRERTGIVVAVEPFVGGDQMLTTLMQRPSEFDLVVVDPEYIEKLARAEVIRPLDDQGFMFDSYFPTLRHFDLSYVDGRLYSVLVRFGINGLLYNSKYLTESEVASYAILKSEKVRARVVFFDWYLPNMGVFSRVANHTTDPFAIDEKQFEALKGFLRDVRPSVRAIQSSFAEMVATLASGDAWLQPTAGESLAWLLRQSVPEIDWTVPAEGGILWCETLAIPVGARNPGSAARVIHFLQSPEGQAALVRRRAYIGSVPNEGAYPLLTEGEKLVLKIRDRRDAEDLLARVSIRRLPVNQTEADWQRAWTAFKVGN